MTPTPEKAAPIPADIQLIAGTLVIPVSKTLSQEQCNDLFGAIMKAFVADRASQEERIREDERDRLLAATGWQNIAAWLESEGAMLPADRIKLRMGGNDDAQL